MIDIAEVRSEEAAHDYVPHDASPAPRLSVVVPIFNEEENITLLYQRVSAAMAQLGQPYEMIAVDDGSRDRSFAILVGLAARDARLRAVRLRRNFGQTAAFAAGFARARGDVVITIDADLQNDPADIPRLLEKLDEGYDVVSGWRKHRQDAFWSRTLPSRLANGLISRVTGLHLHDYGCSLKAYRREVLQNIQLYGELHRFIPAIASWQGVSVAELPVNHAPRHAGTSKYGIGRTLRVVLDLLTVRFLLSYSTRPMQIFGLFGIISILIGGLISAYLATLKLVMGISLSNRPLLLLGVLLIILGVQFISIGLIGELIIRIYYDRQPRRTYVVREELNDPGAANRSGR
jgi:glycosyltransferase involved in cell wall biosynthesis